jgi:hypothetical protein
MNECRLVLDTNIFVAAGFEPKSASARLLEALAGTLSDDLAPGDASGDRAGAAPRPAA